MIHKTYVYIQVHTLILLPPVPFGPGEEWADTFKTEASGTYVKQYMVVDFNRFKPGEPLAKDLLWVVEEIPGLIRAKDMTDTLERGYWPSYNKVGSFSSSLPGSGPGPGPGLTNTSMYV